MSINLIAQQVFSAGLLIADSYNSVNGSIGNTGQLTQVNNQNVCAALEIRSTEGTLLIPRLSNAQIAALPSKGPLVDGMMVYSIDNAAFQLRIANGWVAFTAGAGTGDVSGPDVSVINNIATWANDTGTLLQDSGVSITRIPPPGVAFTAVEVTMLTEIGLVEFTNSRGGLFLTASIDPDANAYLSQNMLLNTTGGLTQACTVFNGTQSGASSSSTNALVELSSTTGALLLSRLTQAEIDALETPINGMIVYNLDANTFSAYQNGGWVNLGAGGSGTVTSIAAGSFLTTGGGPITGAGTISVAHSTANSLLGFDNSGAPANVNANTFVAITSNHIGLVATSTHSTLLGFRSSDGVTSNITLGTNLSMSGTTLNAASGNIGTVTRVDTDNVFLSGGPISTTGTIHVISNTEYANKILGWLGDGAPTVVSAGSGIVITDGVISVEAGGAGTVTNVATGVGLTGGPITTTGTISIADTDVSADTYTFPKITINAQGQAVHAVSYGTITTSNASTLAGNLAGGSNPADSTGLTGFGDRVFANISSPGSIHNTGFGASVLTNLTGTDSTDNTGIGFEALVFNVGGAFNTAIGSSSGASYSSYTGCTFLGAGSDAGSDGLINATAIGYLAIAGASNTLVLGHNSKIGIGINSPAYTLDLANVSTTSPISCAVRFAASTNSPDTPSNTHDLVLFNNAGVLSVKDTSAVVTPIGFGTVTEVDTAGFITGGPITSTGTISVGNSTPGTLLGFDASVGVASNITLGTNLSMSGTTLNATAGSVSITALANRGITLSPNPLLDVGTIAVTEMAIVGAGTGSESLFWGFEAGGTGTAVVVPQCIAIGGLSLNLLSSFPSAGNGLRNISIGAQSLANLRHIPGYSVDYANDNLGVGYKSLGNLMLLNPGTLSFTDISSNVAIGNDSLSKLMQFSSYPGSATYYALGNTSCGNLAGNILNAGFSNSFFGYQAGIVSGDGTLYAQNCTVIGALTTIGFSVALDEVLANAITIIGANTLVNAKSSTAIGAGIIINSQFATALGSESVVQATSDGGTALGAKSLVTSGNAAGTAIGFQSTVNFPNSTALGANVTVNAANACSIGSNQFVGINTDSPSYALDIAPVAPGGVGTAIAAIQLQSNGANVPATPSANSVVIYNGANMPMVEFDDSSVATLLSLSSISAGTFYFPKIVVAANGSITIAADGFENDSNRNLFIGSGTGNKTLTGLNNTGVGIICMPALTTGSYNSGFGAINTLLNLTTGFSNTAFGATVLPGITTDSFNTGMGVGVLSSLGTLGGSGDGNSGFGAGAGNSQKSYSNCTFLGRNADASVDSLTNACAIGYNSLVGIDNALVLGAGAAVGIGNTSPIYTLDLGNISSLSPVSCGVRLAASSNMPSTPANANDVVIFNNAGAPSYVDTTGTVYPFAIGASSPLTPGTYQFASVTVNASGGITSISSSGIDGAGSGNLFIGQNSGNGSVSGNGNTGHGYYSMPSITSGNNNTASGAQSLQDLTSGSYNCAFGNQSLLHATDATGNVAVGVAALTSLPHGNYNTGVGLQPFGQMTDGNYNVGVGASAGFNHTNYYSCTLLGSGADTSSNGLAVATAIGYQAIVGASNSLVLGGTGSYQVNVGIGTTTPQAMLHVVGGQIINRTAVPSTSSPYSALVTDYIIGITDTTSSVSVILPGATADNAGQVYIVKDESGAANVNNITITVSGGTAHIDGSTSAVINVAYGSLSIYSNGSSWNIF